MTDGYRATCELRFVEREEFVPIGMAEVKVVRWRILQQKWVTEVNRGHGNGPELVEEWRDVPTVNE